MTDSLAESGIEEGGDGAAAKMVGELAGCKNLTSLSLDFNCGHPRREWSEALGDPPLLEDPQYKLTDLTLESCHEDMIFLKSLSQNTTLKKLNLERALYCISRAGWGAFSAYLSNPNCSLQELNISENEIDNEGLLLLTEGMSQNSSVRIIDMKSMESVGEDGLKADVIGRNERYQKLDISRNKFHSSTWPILFKSLGEKCILSGELNLCTSSIDNEGIFVLVDRFGTCKTLKVLVLSYTKFIGTSGWKAVANFVKESSILEELDISSCNINDDFLLDLASVLSHNKTLKSLDLAWNEKSVTADGWVTFFDGFQNPERSGLRKVELTSNSIDDEAIPSMVPRLSNMRSLEELRLSFNKQITSSGAQAISNILRSPTSALK